MEAGRDLDEVSEVVMDVPVGPESYLSPRDSTVERQDEDEELDEEDVWIAEEIARQERELLEEEAIDGEHYVPQLMDTLEMRALQSALRRTEAQFEREGRMREYTPRRPATSVETAITPSIRPRRALDGGCQSTSDARDPPADDRSLTARSEPLGRHTRPVSPRLMATPSAQKRVELAQSLRVELRQVRALEQRYSEMKRVLLEHVETICSTKIHDRVGSPETFEQLAELMVFAEHCAASLSSVR